MKIWEILENLDAGASEGSGAVGTANTDSMVLRPPTPMRKMKQIPQVGYGIKIGHMAIPTPGYNPENDLGQVNKITGG